MQRQQFVFLDLLQQLRAFFPAQGSVGDHFLAQDAIVVLPMEQVGQFGFMQHIRHGRRPPEEADARDLRGAAGASQVKRIADRAFDERLLRGSGDRQEGEKQGGQE